MSDGRLKRVKLAFERDFTQVPNEWLRDPQLSLRARGLLALLMSHHEGYVVTHKSLVATNPEGREAIETAVRELKERGYLEIDKMRGRGGRIEGYVWALTDPVEVQKRRSAQVPLFPYSGSTGTRESRNTDNPHLKEAQPTEDITQVLNAGDSTRAGVNEDASGDSHQAATFNAVEFYERSLHARCAFFPRHNRECDWAASGYCNNCGRERPSLIEEAES